MLSLNRIVTVVVNAASGGSSGEDGIAGLILNRVSSAPSEARRLQTYASAADMLSAGYAATDEAYLAAVAYFSANPAPSRLLVSDYPSSSESPSQGLAKLLERTDAFCAVYNTDHTAAGLRDLPRYLASSGIRAVSFGSLIGAASDIAGSGGPAATLHGEGNDRAVLIKSSQWVDAAAVMGTAVGLAEKYADSSFALCYKTVPGREPDTTLTESDVETLTALGVNVYVLRGYNRLMLQNGSVISGRRWDEVFYQDRIAADLQAAALSLLTASSGKLPQTDETSAVFINRFSAVLASYAARGVLAPGIWRGGAVGRLSPGDMVEAGYLLWADSYDTQSDADRAAHKAMPIHIALCPAGSVETLLISVDVGL